MDAYHLPLVPVEPAPPPAPAIRPRQRRESAHSQPDQSLKTARQSALPPSGRVGDQQHIGERRSLAHGFDFAVETALAQQHAPLCDAAAVLGHPGTCRAAASPACRSTGHSETAGRRRHRRHAAAAGPAAAAPRARAAALRVAPAESIVQNVQDDHGVGRAEGGVADVRLQIPRTAEPRAQRARSTSRAINSMPRVAGPAGPAAMRAANCLDRSSARRPAATRSAVPGRSPSPARRARPSSKPELENGAKHGVGAQLAAREVIGEAGRRCGRARKPRRATRR